MRPVEEPDGVPTSNGEISSGVLVDEYLRAA